jgi:hypothetical protein
MVSVYCCNVFGAITVYYFSLYDACCARGSEQADFAGADADRAQRKVSLCCDWTTHHGWYLNGCLHCLLHGMQAELAESKAEADRIRVSSMWHNITFELDWKLPTLL